MRWLLDRIHRALNRLDDVQKRHVWTAFPAAVAKKFADDNAGRFAALIAYYGFFSIFPLMLVLVTLVGYVIRNDRQLQLSIIHSAVSQFPVIGAKIEQSVHALRGSIPALVFGIVTSLWAGLGVVNTIQSVMDEIWYVPKARRRGFPQRVARGALVLLILGVLIVVSGALAGIVTSSSRVPMLARAASFLIPVVLDAVFLVVLFTWLPARDVSWSDALPGAIAGAVAWEVLISIGAFLVDRKVRDATQLYGFFGTVLGLLSWLFLGAQILVIAAEINVVRAEHLWPRSLFPPPLEDQDRRVLAERAEVERARPDEDVHVHFEGVEGGPRRGPDAG
jgi:YihY family inner membrane protein